MTKEEPREIGYTECVAALIKMLLSDIITSREYKRIIKKLDKAAGKGR